VFTGPLPVKLAMGTTQRGRRHTIGKKNFYARWRKRIAALGFSA